eukprot:gene18012-24422_t
MSDALGGMEAGTSSTSLLDLPNQVIDAIADQLWGRDVLSLRAVHTTLRWLQPRGKCPLDLQELLQVMTSADSPLLVDLCGRCLSSKKRTVGQLLLSVAGVHLRDGTIELPSDKDELVICGQDVLLEAVTIRRKSGTKDAKDVLLEAVAILRKSKAKEAKVMALEVARRGLTSVRNLVSVEGVKGASFVGCNVHGLLEVVRGCVFRGSPLNGLFVSESCSLHLSGCTIHSHAASGVVACTWSEVLLESCEIRGNKCHGVACFQARLQMEHCELRSNRESALEVEMGADVRLSSCTVEGGRRPAIHGFDAKLTLSECSLDHEPDVQCSMSG